MAHNTIEKWMEELRGQPEYAAEGLVLDFIGACELRRAELGLSYAELARRMGVSRAYVTKLMGGAQRSSVGSLVKLACALDCEVRLELALPRPATRGRELSVSRSSTTRTPAAKPAPAPTVVNR